MDLRAYTYDLPLASPFRIAYDVVTKSENALVKAEQDGLTGYGEAGPTPTITGETPTGVRQALQGLPRRGLPGRFPVTAYGLAAGLAIETAWLDLAARLYGEPVCTHLNGARPRAVESSITIPILDGEELHERIAAVTPRFSVFKVKAGNGLENDLARIQAVREAVGDAELRVDPNQAWTREESLTALPQLQDLGVDVLEQPLGISDLKGHASLVGVTDVPIMLDESVFSPEHAMQAIAAKACDRINIKLQKSGSLRRALEIADIAAASDVPCMLGCMIESRVGILAGAHVVAAHDNILWADLDGATFLRNDPVTGGPVMQDGRIRLDDSAGLGIDGVEHGAPLAELVA